MNIGGDGQTVARFPSETEPMGHELIKQMEKALEAVRK
jgi:hypothetical protein